VVEPVFPKIATMQSPLGNVVSFAALAAVILAMAVVFLAFPNRVKSVSSRILPDEMRKRYRLGRAPGIAAIRFVGVLSALMGLTALAGSIYWASKL
jgi:hypothetical protein